MLKILLPLVIEKHFICLLKFDFFAVLEKIRSCCLIETNQLSKYCLAKDISKSFAYWLFVSAIKVNAISYGIPWNLQQNTTDIYYIKRKVAITFQIFTISEISGDLYCNHSAN